MILCSIILFCSCIQGTKDTNFKVEILPTATKAMQQQMIGQLSGKFGLSNKLKIPSRWTPLERKLTRHYLKELIIQLGLSPLEHQYTQSNINFGVDILFEPFTGANIYTILPATIQSDQYIILGAHYDTGLRNAPGAIDNATGMALIYSVLRELKKLTYRKLNVIMVFFDQEEEENVGSSEFIRLIKKNNWNISSVHCFDMVGWDSNNDEALGIYTASKELGDKYLSIAKKVDKQVFKTVIDPIGYENNSTDFDEFVRSGFNVIGAGECYYHGDTTPYKDTPKDAFETVNFEYLLSSTKYIELVITDVLKNRNHE